MPIALSCTRAARDRGPRALIAALLALGTGLAACAPQDAAAPAASTSPPAAPAIAAAPPAAPTAAPAAPPALPFDEAVLSAANTVFGSARLDGDRPHMVVIDPLVDGVTGAQSRATRTIQSRITGLVRERYPAYAVQPFTAEAVNRAPLVLVGTFTPIGRDGRTAGTREAYRFCLVLADLRTGRTVAKGVARAQLSGVDATPTRSFQDSPAWTQDRRTQAYINTCQGTKVGDPIDPAYVDGILAAALIAEAIETYDAGRWRDALELYESALRTPAGDQLRVYNGIYLAHARLGQRDRAEADFGRIVDYGLRNNRLAVKLLFRSGSVAFLPDAQVSADYALWLRQIARRAEQSPACLEVDGHASPGGSPALNERLSLLRAEFVKARLETEAPGLARRLIANGVGARENLVGTGAEDESDALDRRVEFKVIPSC